MYGVFFLPSKWWLNGEWLFGWYVWPFWGSGLGMVWDVGVVSQKPVARRHYEVSGSLALLL